MATSQDTINLPDTAPKIVDRILEYLYTGSCSRSEEPDLDDAVAEAMDMYLAAVRFEIHELKDHICEGLRLYLRYRDGIEPHLFRGAAKVYTSMERPGEEFRAIIRIALYGISPATCEELYTQLDTEVLMPIVRQGGLFAEDVFAAKQTAFLMDLRRAERTNDISQLDANQLQSAPYVCALQNKLKAAEVAAETLVTGSVDQLHANPNVRALQEKLRAAETQVATYEKYKAQFQSVSTKLGQFRKHHRELHPSCDKSFN